MGSPYRRDWILYRVPYVFRAPLQSIYSVNLSVENAKFSKNRPLFWVMAKLDNVPVLAANETAPLAVAKLVGNADCLCQWLALSIKKQSLPSLTKEIENIK